MAITNKAKALQKARKEAKQAAVIENWATALESGKYKKTTGSLHVEKNGKHGFCCLGVLCELAIKDGVPVEVKSTGSFLKTYYYDGDLGTLPESVTEWAGLSTEHGDYTNKAGHGISLIVQNDDNRRTFKQIAQIIRSKPEGLFEPLS